MIIEELSILATGLRFPEGLTFDRSGRLWCAERQGGGVVCYHKNGQLERVQTGGKPCGMALDQAGSVWFCDTGQNAIRRFHPDQRHIETVVDQFNGLPLRSPNDLRFDPTGNLIFTCPGPVAEEAGINQMEGMVLALTNNGSVQVIADELDYPNGLAFIPGTDTLLIAETQKQRIWSGFWDAETPSWDTIDVWATVGTERHLSGPYGLAIGPDGTVYAAIFGAGLIKVFDADGQFLRDIRLPGQKPTSCVFDPDGQSLIVSEAERGELLRIII